MDTAWSSAPDALAGLLTLTGAGPVYDLNSLSLCALAEHYVPASRERVWATKVGRAEVRSANLMTRLFSEADSAFGGGFGRAALWEYLRATVGPWLRMDAAASVRLDLYVAAAQLTYLCGFMLFDDGLHGVAQRCYLASLRLAGEAGDATGRAIALRALSVQARSLRHSVHAADLAEAAVAAAPGNASPRIRAFLVGQLAVASAATGDRHTALRQLVAAEGFLEKSTEGSQPVGAYHAASLAHQQAAVAALLGDRRTAMRALRRSVRHRPASERRARAITLARLAELYLAEGQLEPACEAWHQFLDDYPHLRSRRVTQAFTNLRASARPHQHNSSAGELLRRAAALNAGG